MNIEPTIPEHLELFSAFQHTLSSLSLIALSITWSTFVALVGYFPNLRALAIIGTSLRVDDRPVPHIPHPLRGRLFIDLTSKRDLDLPIDRFPGLGLEYEELGIYGAYEHRLVAAIERSLRRLKINQCGCTSSQSRRDTGSHDSNFSASPTQNLSRCSELHQLEITMTHPGNRERILISSINSTNFRTLIFTSPITCLKWDSLWDNPCWPPFDDMVCGLVDRLRMSGCRHTLELEFRAEFVELDGKVYHKEFLPRFKEKGRVRIVEISSGRFWEWP